MFYTQVKTGLTAIGDNYLPLGVKGVITKPFDPLKLNNQVLDILNLNAVKI